MMLVYRFNIDLQACVYLWREIISGSSSVRHGTGGPTGSSVDSIYNLYPNHSNKVESLY